MHQEIAKKWAEELRSGRYKQGVGYLRKGDKYCCLGVLCEIMDPKMARLAVSAKHGVDAYLYNGNFEVLPDTVMGWAGMKTSNGGFKGKSSFNTDVAYGGCLASRNDAGVLFSEIADLIDANWAAL